MITIAAFDTSDATITALYAAASRVTDSPAEQTWLVMHCVRGRHDAAWLDRRNPNPPPIQHGRHPVRHDPPGLGLYPDIPAV